MPLSYHPACGTVILAALEAYAHKDKGLAYRFLRKACRQCREILKEQLKKGGEGANGKGL